jgi:hypothetical protein
MKSEIVIPIRGDRQEDFRSEAIVGQCRLLASRAELGLPLDQRSLDNLMRLSREISETK